MRIIGYRWDELAEGCRADSRLNIMWQRMIGEMSPNGWSIESYPINREILVFEGDSDQIAAVRKATESLTGSELSDG